MHTIGTNQAKFNKEYDSMTVFYSASTPTVKIYFVNSMATNLVEVLVDREIVPVSSLTQQYNFQTTGRHYIMYRYKNLSSLPSKAFSGCTSIYHVIFSNSVESLNNGYTFNSCPLLGREKPIILPENLSTGGYSAFLINTDTNPVRKMICLRETPPVIQDRFFACYANGAFRYTKSHVYVKYSEDHHILQAYQADTQWQKYQLHELNPDGTLPQ